VGWFGLLAIFFRVALLKMTGPGTPLWLHETLHFDWWSLQPALWATAVQQTRQLRHQTADLKAENINLKKQKEALQHELGTTQRVGLLSGFAAGMAVAAATTSGMPRDLCTRLPSRQFSGLSRDCSMLRTSPSSSAKLVGGSLFASSIAAVAVLWVTRRVRPCLHHHVSKELTAHCVRRTVTIECPGVLRSGIIVRLPPQINGADVEIKRLGAIGITAALWQRRFKFPWEEGIFECRQEEMQLENGILRLVFESELKRERLVHLPPPRCLQVFTLSEDDESTSKLPSCDVCSQGSESSSSASLFQPEDESSPTASPQLRRQISTIPSDAAKFDEKEEAEEEQEEEAEEVGKEEVEEQEERMVVMDAGKHAKRE